jgi:hypothetical protein
VNRSKEPITALDRVDCGATVAQKLPVIVIAHVRQQKRATARWASTRWLRCSARDGVINGEQAIAIVAKHWRVPATAEHSYVAIDVLCQPPL